MRNGIFSKPMSGLDVFGSPSLGALGGVVEDQIAQCVKNSMATPCAFSEAARQDIKAETGKDPCPPRSLLQIETDCKKFFTTAVSCATKCQSLRQDSPEWAACVQRCHGYSPVDYTAQKAGCEAQGKIYSWLEGGCVSKEKYNSCPPGTVYATYKDGTEKCIGIPVDLTTDKCPPGTTLQDVPGGKTCVSPVVPGEPPKPAPPKPAPPKPAPPKPEDKTPPPGEQKAGFPLLIVGAVVLGAAVLFLAKGKNKSTEPIEQDVPKLMSEPNRRPRRRCRRPPQRKCRCR